MFAEMPLDNARLVKFTLLAASRLALLGLLNRLERHRRRNDLIFRSDRQFCNIEPKIRQYD
jgi:hypothetical protein